MRTLRTLGTWMNDISFTPTNNKFIFQQLVQMYGTSMSSIGISHTQSSEESEYIDVMLDINYTYQHAYSKNLSLFWEKVVGTSTTAAHASSHIKVIAETIYYKYYQKWKKIYDALAAEYNPVHNYNMTEHHEINSKVTNERDVTNDAYGFNSGNEIEDAVPSSTGTQSDTTSGTIEDNFEDTTRYGNIGVTTSQKMLQEELQVRMNNFYEIMFADIDEVICLKVY